MNKVSPKLNPLKKWLLRGAKLLALLFVLLCVLVVYAESKVRWAKQQVEAFNDSIEIGMSISDLNSKAEHFQLMHKQFPKDNNGGTFVAWEGFVFDRWFCDVEYKNGKVTSAKITFLD